MQQEDQQERRNLPTEFEENVKQMFNALLESGPEVSDLSAMAERLKSHFNHRISDYRLSQNMPSNMRHVRQG